MSPPSSQPGQGGLPPAANRTAAEPAPLWPVDALEVGRIVDAWGIKGWLKAQPFSSDPQALISATTWFLQPPERAAPGVRRGAWPSTLSVLEARVHGDVVVALVDGCVDRAAAEALRGARVFIARSQFPEAGKDEFYWVDLIGLAVSNRAGQSLGTVTGLIDTGPHCVLRVGVDDGANDGVGDGVDADRGTPERLIPFVAAYVDDVDLCGRRITVDWGLDY